LSISRPAIRITIEGVIPGAPADEAALLRARIAEYVTQFSAKYRPDPFQLVLRHGEPPATSGRAWYEAAVPGVVRGKEEPEASGDEPEFVAIKPNYRLDQVMLAAGTMERLLDCVSFVEVSRQVFDVWGLREIEPHPSIAVNFRGPPGTGKTMAAHAAASHLGKKIMLSRLSDLESKYHGQGPKNLVGLFRSAANQDAVIFIDEAESLLSRRFSQPEQAAESAINSMRTELLMALDSYDGLVIFASNLPHSYDVAIESRILHVDFDLPDRAARRAIWRVHLPGTLPLHDGVSLDRLADIDGVSGRDIKLAVISAAIGAARRKAPVITEAMLIDCLNRQRPSPSEPQAESVSGDPDLAARIRAGLDHARTSTLPDQAVPG
jgi:SpoVK/Ycf46/Vps4 family AAA+-type ATPase